MPFVGQRNGRIVSITPHYGPHGKLKCVVRCDCGVEKEIWAGNFYKTQSCGCYKVEVAGIQSTTHGFRRGDDRVHPCGEYHTWAGMIQRCTNPKNPNYPNYGGRGIKVCARWRSFENFYKDMGPRPSAEYEIDRYPDNDGDYKLSNCRWTTPIGQGRNKRNNVHVTVGIERVVKSEAAARAGVNIGTFHGRIERGWSGDEASSVPVKPRPELNFRPGTVFGHLTVIRAVGQKTKNKHTYYEMLCTCGNKANVRSSHLKAKVIRYCNQYCIDRRSK